VKTILITGGIGFIGTNLALKLLDLGNKVVAVDNFYSSSPERLKVFANKKNFSFIQHDIRKPLKIDQKIDEIYNLACPASPPIYQKDPIFTLETSVLGIRNMLKLAKKHKAKILQASTSEVYGNPLQHPQKESYWGNVNPVGPRSCYDEGKRVAETFCCEYFNKGVDVRVVRIFNTYGPFMNPTDGRVVVNFIVQALKNEDLTIYGDGSQTRSFCYVDDLIEGMIKYMELKERFFGPINLGNPGEFTIKQLAEMVLRLIPESKSKIVYLPLPKDDPEKRKPDISLAQKILKWEPKIKLEEGLFRTIDYFRKYGVSL
jgi:UDP-glucuronate decarboxylase